MVMWMVARPIDLVSDKLRLAARQRFASPLRSAVMKAILGQDTEFFDLNSTGELQERLNRDTNELVEDLLQLPHRVSTHFFRVCQRTLNLYIVAPHIMWACLSVNVPLFAAVFFLTHSRLVKLAGKQRRGSDRAAADTIEILHNVKSVRQYSMEGGEERKFTLNSLARNVVEMRISALENVAHLLRDGSHHFGEVRRRRRAWGVCA